MSNLSAAELIRLSEFKHHYNERLELEMLNRMRFARMLVASGALYEGMPTTETLATLRLPGEPLARPFAAWRDPGDEHDGGEGAWWHE